MSQVNYNKIIDISVMATETPKANVFMKKATLVTCGGSNLPTGESFEVLARTQTTNGKTILKDPLPITAFSMAAGVTTVTCTHGQPIGSTSTVYIKAANGVPAPALIAATFVTATTFTIQSSDPWVLPASVETHAVWLLRTQLDTWFSGTANQSVFVSELGVQASSTAEVTAFTTWFPKNTDFFSYTLDGLWADQQSFIDFAVMNDAVGKLPVFILGLTDITQTAKVKGHRCIISVINRKDDEPKTSPAAEIAYAMARVVNPSSPLANFNFRYVSGVQPYDVNENIPQLLANNCNYIGTGSEGNIDGVMPLRNGVCADGSPILATWAVSRMITDITYLTAAFVLNNSQPSANPLSLDTRGIQDLVVLLQTISKAAVGMKIIEDQLQLIYLPFEQWRAANASDYKAGKYTGMRIVMSPKVGLNYIYINLNVEI